MGTKRMGPFEVEAWQFVGVPPDGTNADELIAWMTAGHTFARILVMADDSIAISIETPKGTKVVFLDDWIIRNDKGEFYPCKPDIVETELNRRRVDVASLD